MKYICPIKGLELVRKCPVNTCMWYSKNHNTGCFNGDVLIENDKFLAGIKGVEEIDTELEKAKKRIRLLLVLDGFCTYLMGKEIQVPQKHMRMIQRLLESLPQLNVKHGWTIELLYTALNKKVWFEFKRTISEEDIIHREVLGLTQKHYKKLQSQLEN